MIRRDVSSRLSAENLADGTDLPPYDVGTMETAFVAIDVETANADRSSICQIGAVRIENGAVTDTFATLVDPETYFDPWNIQIHGITAGMVQGQPAFPVVARGLSEFVASAVVASHTAFDRLAVDPIAHVDDLNSLSFLDYLREVVLTGKRQVFFATANDKLAALFERKFDFLGAEGFCRFNLQREAGPVVSPA